MKWLALRIGGQRVPVHLVPPKHPKLEGALGFYREEEGAIYISNALGPDVREDTLFHELDHAVNAISGAKTMIETLAPSANVDVLEEQLVRSRTPVWHALLKDLGFRFPKGPNE